MAVTAAKLRKLDSENAKTVQGESLWVTVVLESSEELQGYYRHDAVSDTVSVKVPGRRGRMKAYSINEINDIEVTEAPKEIQAQEATFKKVSTPSRQGTRTVTSIKDAPLDNGRREAVGAASKKLAAPAGVLCYITGQPTDPRKDVAVFYEGNKYFIKREAFLPVLQALQLVEEEEVEAPAAEAPAAKRRPGRPAGSKSKATTVRRARG